MWRSDAAGFWEKQRPRLLFGLLCLAGAVALGRVAVIAQALPPWQDFWIVFLFALFLMWASVATFLARNDLAQIVSATNVETRLNEWFLRFRFANQKLADSANSRFAYRVTAPQGQVVIISLPTGLDNYLRYRAELTIPERHRRALNDMGENGRRRFMIEYMAECAKARVHLISARALPLTVKVERTVPITRRLDSEDLWAALEAIQQDLNIALTHVDLSIERIKAQRPLERDAPIPLIESSVSASLSGTEEAPDDHREPPPTHQANELRLPSPGQREGDVLGRSEDNTGHG